MMQLHQQIGTTVKDLYKQALQTDPSLKQNPKLASATVDAMIAQNKSLSDSQREALTAYADVARNQLMAKEAENKANQAALKLAEDERTKMAKLQVSTQIAAQNGLNKIKIAELNDESREEVASMTGKDRLAAAGITANARTDAAKIAAGAKNFATKYGGDVKMWGDQLASDARIYGAQAGNAPIGQAPKPPAERQRPTGSGAPAGDESPPPQALQHLKEGQNATFANGQTWTMKNGKPVRVS